MVNCLKIYTSIKYGIINVRVARTLTISPVKANDSGETLSRILDELLSLNNIYLKMGSVHMEEIKHATIPNTVERLI